MPNQVSERFSKICQTSGLKLKNIVLRPFATLDLLSQSIQNRELCLVADPNGDCVDLTLVNNGSPILTRTIRADAEGDISELGKTLSGEIRRTVAAAQMRLGNRQISRIVVVGSDSKFGVLCEPLSESLECETEIADPFDQVRIHKDKPESPEKFASLIGCLVQQGENKPYSLDFLNAKKAVVEKTDNRRSLIIAGAIAATFLMCVFVCWLTLRSQKNSIKKNNEELAKLKTENEGGNGSKSVDQIIGEVGVVDNWINKSPNWLDELEATSLATLDADRTVVDRFFARIGKDKSTINMQFRLNEMATGTDLEKALANRPYILTRRGTSKNEKSEEYRASTELDLEIENDELKTRDRMDAIARSSLYGDSSESEGGN